jgi:hypothetical protein
MPYWQVVTFETHRFGLKTRPGTSVPEVASQTSVTSAQWCPVFRGCCVVCVRSSVECHTACQNCTLCVEVLHAIPSAIFTYFFSVLKINLKNDYCNCVYCVTAPLLPDPGTSNDSSTDYKKSDVSAACLVSRAIDVTLNSISSASSASLQLGFPCTVAPPPPTQCLVIIAAVRDVLCNETSLVVAVFCASVLGLRWRIVTWCASSGQAPNCVPP